MSDPLDIDAMVDFIDAEFRHQYRNVVDQVTLPIPRRIDQFTCWPGLAVVGVENEGARLELSFKTNPSKLRQGEHVYVNQLSVEPKDVITGPEGVVVAIDEKRRRVVVEAGYQQTQRFHRRFRLDDRLVLDSTLPGAHIGRDMPTLALRVLAGDHGRHPRIDLVRGILEGRRGPLPSGDRPFDPTGDPLLESLTPAQTEALRRAVETDLALIQGPPGTGKTFVLGLVIRELVRRGLRVGVCAFTHQAINNVLLECLRHEDIPDVAKLGSPSSWPGGVESPRLELVRAPSAFFRRKGTPAVTGFTQHAAFHPVSRSLSGDLESAFPRRFDVLVFDEAGQLTLPAATMAMFQADRFVIAGDHKQLPPVVATVRPGEGLGTSVFRRLVEDAGQEPVLLDRTFRMNDELTAFPSETFYGGRLASAPMAAARRLEPRVAGPRAGLLAPEQPSTLAIVRHQGRGQESPEEAALVAALVHDAIEAGLPPEEIAVIAPHRRQNVKIREFLALLGHSGSHPLVDTVERIQGQERDLVVLSMTLSDPDVIAGESDFLFLPNRLNVALTRARKKLVVVGSPALFRALPARHALAAPGPNPLEGLNVLKRWYFRHKRRAIDATSIAAEALRDLSSRSEAHEESAGRR